MHLSLFLDYYSSETFELACNEDIHNILDEFILISARLDHD